MPSLKAVLFEINGVFINDADLQFALIDEILLAENLQPTDRFYRDSSLGKSDRCCLKENLATRGRILSEEQLDKLIQRKSQIYQQKMAEISPFPLWEDVLPCISAMKLKNIPLGIVTGYCRSDAEFILRQAQLDQTFDVIVTADEVKAFKPSGDSYRLAIAQLNQKFPGQNIQSENCLAIEDNFHGIQAAKSAGIPVVGVAHTYPFHMLQRCSNWCVDYLTDLELERIDPSLAPPAEVLK
ncbi:haloacid dehalogenase-superfamily hydrolase, subfamily IA, variant 3 [[Synechococcus] sp. NIES-970]|uniref:HAD family hydrolase n=1 Tax=Picosynechococcus sp. NKBG15041c TaxID=1407650 RepID=UPI00040BD0A2|nr:HAD family phosphatase [Picosynechococcus sp. NKBG15041c]BAW95488.1 haloacid dehalogenase-superfamily hydrolase, subfamily IA, variant 3 [[Synechococcus] sp. NIES-970]